ncbi:dTDP-4-dehydrorhamnose reductase [Brenneria alni]|uniref:dTDP-4-dehydrorhamnose reductase n=1 Tax=Brenneria alni TaxID=71656 RepID=A0A421DJ51_9GAMM|nr:dTDP-4-dehydrorhamnose reductase [Brenneria alni]RLM18275.1 dTDP-4-dehydrorhamnose reductase [Brenneria alni]
MKVLLTGAKGQLGRCFQDRLPEGWTLLATDSDELDITDADKVSQTVQEHHPDVIVNAAAYTAVDKAESEPELAARINVTGPQNLARAASSINARLVHVSTDYVFDGKSERPYIETDPVNPLGVYGKTKLDGERMVLKEASNSIIVRTAWVFSEYGNNFVKTMLRLGKEQDSLGIVSDQRGCPTYAGDIAGAIIQLINKDANAGIYHYCGDKEVSWYEFAKYIFNEAADNKLIAVKPRLNSLLTIQYPTPTERPKYSVLSCDKIISYGISLSSWRVALENILRKMYV